MTSLGACLELEHILYFKMAFEIAEMKWKDGQESAAQKVVAEQKV